MFDQNMRVVKVIGYGFIAFAFTASAAFAVDGWASMNGGTTGGAGGTTYTVTSAANFKSYVETEDTPYIVRVSGIIDLEPAGGKVSIRSNKTIEAAGPGAGIIGQLGFKNGRSNVIIRRLTITNPSYGEKDGISLKDDINNVFITKCTFYDCNDGCLDITKASDYVTVSWCKFYYVEQASHRNVNLIGSSDGGDTSDDMGKLHVTFHHNWWSTLCDQRMPSVRYGRAHCYNNYYDCPDNLYCIRTRLYAECLVENNYFKEVQNPWERYITDPCDDLGLLYETGNILDNVTWDGSYDSRTYLIDGNDTVFTPPYSYTLDDANDVPAIVQYGAGADGKDGYPPHWFFSLYGDFDLSGLVDTNDFVTFVDYWLDTNAVADINDADHNGDGIVNGYEYALFADDYLYVAPDTTPPASPADLWAQAGDSTVSLDWADNSEADFDGYNVYRSTTSGEDYTKLNTSLLSDSNYIDNTVSNTTMYYYVVTATDTNDNESNHSTEACAVPDVNTSITIQENATGFCGVDGIIDTKHAGYTGSGFCDTENTSDQGIDWSMSIAAADTYTFTWRYAHGKTDDRTARLLVNGSPVVASITFPQTGAWTTWSTVSVDVSMTTGAKQVRLEGTTSNGLANIDYMMVTGSDPEVASCP